MARNPRIVAFQREFGTPPDPTGKNGPIPAPRLPVPMRHGRFGIYRERSPRMIHIYKRPSRKVTVW